MCYISFFLIFLIFSESEIGPVMSDSLQLHGLYSPWNSPGQNTGGGSLSLCQPRDWTQVSRNAGGFFTSWATRETQRNGNLLQYSCLENLMDRGSWWATVHRVAKSWTWLKQLSTGSQGFTPEFTTLDQATSCSPPLMANSKGWWREGTPHTSLPAI